MIFVTGASGNVGREVVAQLTRRQAPFRVGVRQAERTVARGIATKAFDFLDAQTFHGAVVDCSAVFLMRPPAIANTKATLNSFLDVTRRCGVTQVVFLSVSGADANPFIPHHAVEQHLRAGPSGWTVLRPGFFAQNLGDAYRDDILKDDRIYLPAGAALVAFIDARDIAEVAANALTDPVTHAGQIYTLTGMEALSFAEIASMLSDELGRTIRYQPASILGYLAHLSRRGLPATQVMIQTLLHLGLRFGQAQSVTGSLAGLLGRRPFTMREVCARSEESLALNVMPVSVASPQNIKDRRPDRECSPTKTRLPFTVHDVALRLGAKPRDSRSSEPNAAGR